MKGIKIELLGIGIILTGIAFSFSNIFGFVGGIVGLCAVICGCFDEKYKE